MEASLVFKLISSLIILGMLLYFGADTIGKLLGISGQGSLVSSIKSMENSVNRAYNLPRDSSLPLIELIVPQGFNRICFIDPKSDLTQPFNDGSWVGLERSEERVAIGAIQFNEYNLYAFSSGDNVGQKVEKMRPNENFCITGKADLVLTSRYNESARESYVEVSRA